MRTASAVTVLPRTMRLWPMVLLVPLPQDFQLPPERTWISKLSTRWPSGMYSWSITRLKVLLPASSNSMSTALTSSFVAK